jgi:hypothetical protein
MIVVISGLPGAGKSLKLARVVVDLLYRNRAWYNNPKNKDKIKRILYTNLKLAPALMKEFEGYIHEWTETIELVKTRNCDVIWDELATAMDATQWQNMSLELKRWLQQHRKYGIEIYGTTQDFAQVDKSFRRLVSDLIHVTKIIGSRDKSSTMPEVKRIWGICTVRTLDAQKYNEESSKFEATGLPQFMLITKKDIEIYDTTAEIKLGAYPPLRHITRSCENDNCDHVKTLHV